MPTKSYVGRKVSLKKRRLISRILDKELSWYDVDDMKKVIGRLHRGSLEPYVTWTVTELERHYSELSD
jgi:hypothetical protein